MPTAAGHAGRASRPTIAAEEARQFSMTASAHSHVDALSDRPLVLRLYPDPVLRDICQPLRQSGRNIETFARDMLVLMRQRRGIGLAAPQVGFPIRLIVACVGNETVCVVDPELLPDAKPR